LRCNNKKTIPITSKYANENTRGCQIKGNLTASKADFRSLETNTIPSLSINIPNINPNTTNKMVLNIFIFPPFIIMYEKRVYII
jgi:hypothetical protein